jgi:hypothetical protein
MNRLAMLAIVVLCPVAHAQDDYVEGRKLADAFSQADLDALGRCQARVEGAGVILRDLEPWLIGQNQTGVLDALRSQVAKGAPVLEALSEVRQQTSAITGMSPAGADAAHAAMLQTFKRTPGEDETSFYNRAQPQTKLPPECGEALKRGRWKAGLDGVDEDN